MALVACQDDELPSEPLLYPPPATTPPAKAAEPFDVTACRACLVESCTPERVRCFSVDGCADILNCADDTNCNAKCIQECAFKQTTLGRREYLALSNCEFEATCGRCASSCGNSPLCVIRSAPDQRPVDAPRTCSDCMKERCADRLAKCAPGTECASYFDCTKPCPEPRAKCISVCNDKSPQGRADAQAAYECTQKECKQQCVF